MTYSIAYSTVDGDASIHSFSSAAKARNFANWLLGRSFVSVVSVYRGEVGGELLARLQQGSVETVTASDMRRR